MNRLLTITILCAFGASCGETGGTFVEVPFEARGTAPDPFTKDGWEVTLGEATLGFGPIYFCATDSALSSRCEVAVLEFLDGITLNGLEPAPQSIGSLSGTTGTVRTAFFDYGIVWLLTQPLPEALPGVPGGPAVVRSENPSYVPEGHSARFSGNATCVADPEICCPGEATCPCFVCVRGQRGRARGERRHTGGQRPPHAAGDHHGASHSHHHLRPHRMVAIRRLRSPRRARRRIWASASRAGRSGLQRVGHRHDDQRPTHIYMARIHR